MIVLNIIIFIIIRLVKKNKIKDKSFFLIKYNIYILNLFDKIYNILIY